MSKYLDPKSDVVFKKIFGLHPHLLISFLNAVLPLSSDAPIVELSYLSSEQVPEIPEFKRTIADVKCKDQLGRSFIVEMQINWTDSFKQRLLFSTSQAVVKQLDKGQTYNLLQPVYGLGLIADIFDPDNSEWYHHYQLVKQDTPRPSVIEHLQLIFIELPKFPIHSRVEKKLRLLWLRFLNEINEKTTIVAPELLQVPEISEAIALAEQSAYSKEELNFYEEYWDSVSRERSVITDSYDKGKAEGLVEGKAEGLVEGRAEIIREMYRSGLSIQQITQFTGETEEKINFYLAKI